MEAKMKLFVPGRICLFGEHTDWAGSYRRINGELEKGYCLLTGTNQGIYAEVKPHPSKLIFHATLNDGTRHERYEAPMEREALLHEAEKGGFFSYAAGVACQVLTHYRVRGLEIDNFRTDLPIKKGLSSSAAVCVLVARAFNRIYDLKMTIRGEMEYAYLGEIATPSRCGRMDQGCAYGNRPILLTFDGDRIDVTELSVPSDLYYVIVDLCAGKDTKEILNRLNHCYPFAENQIQKKVQEYLGPLSSRITHRAVKAMQSGDAQSLGKLMKEAQDGFDTHCQPACPSQLTAPVLHKVLAYPPIQPFVLGGKGVGSQGDGTVQFIVKDQASQDKVAEILERDLKMPCLKLAIRTGRHVRKAVIPAAGFGTRLFPATKAMKKELFPVIDSDGRAKPAMLIIIEEAIRAGIEEICLVVQPEDRAVFWEFFCDPPPIQHFNKLSKEDQKYSDYLRDLGHRITFVTQNTQDGFGHAVYCAKEWVGNEPFLLMLGDHLYRSETESPCARQILDVYEKSGVSVVGLKVTPASQLHLFGCVGGVWQQSGDILTIDEFAEKPNAEYARNHLAVEKIDEGNYLTVFGQYVLKPKIFEFLEEAIAHNMREKGEFQLTSHLDKLRQEDGFVGFVVRGKRFDIGVPQAYRDTVTYFSEKEGKK
jgi:UTP-glucose-1-phosphate uridylyltransferase/galactokinase